MRWLIGLVALLASTNAQAAWHEASSEHFVVYADQSEKQVRNIAEMLERYHSALDIAVKLDAPKPSPSNRVRVYVVESWSEVANLAGGSSVAGFYQSRPGGSYAVVPKVSGGGRNPALSLIVLLHEYAHHYFISNTSFSLPRWLNEGSADFFSASRIRDDGEVILGRPNGVRLDSLRYGKNVTVRELLELSDEPLDTGGFYAKSWLLYHYLMVEESRKGQLRTYVLSLMQGAPSEAAARQAFGDLDQLEKELSRYRRNSKMLAFQVPASATRVGEITVRRLREGEEKVMPLHIRSHNGVNEETAAELVVELRKVAGRYPSEPAAHAALAEAEYDAGNDDAAIAAADSAIAIDPTQVNAYVQKGYALFRKAREAEDKDAAYQQAMQPFSALNAMENDHPLPLIYYFRSFAEREQSPSENAENALMQAVGLAPFDMGLRMTLAVHLLQKGDEDGARVHLARIAFNPHGGTMAGKVRTLLSRLDEDGVLERKEIEDILTTSGESEEQAGTGPDESEPEGKG